ncbi:hypothetical protein [Bacillus cereus group sp. BfR-BA-01328]|uniref:hypothetical protein n=1 Tax=Bacillus cereus group sp. BfR-BA-01328 TaxID=2920304 RepID=UPI001F5809FE
MKRKSLFLAISALSLLLISGCEDDLSNDAEKEINNYTKYDKMTRQLTHKVLDTIPKGKERTYTDIKHSYIVTDNQDDRTYQFLVPYELTNDTKIVDDDKMKHYGYLTFPESRYYIDISSSPDIKEKQLIIKHLENGDFSIRYVLPENSQPQVAFSESNTTEYRSGKNSTGTITHTEL